MYVEYLYKRPPPLSAAALSSPSAHGVLWHVSWGAPAENISGFFVTATALRVRDYVDLVPSDRRDPACRMPAVLIIPPHHATDCRSQGPPRPAGG